MIYRHMFHPFAMVLVCPCYADNLGQYMRFHFYDGKISRLVAFGRWVAKGQPEIARGNDFVPVF